MFEFKMWIFKGVTTKSLWLYVNTQCKVYLSYIHYVIQINQMYIGKYTTHWVCWAKSSHHFNISHIYIYIYLVGGFNPFEKILVKLHHFPRWGWKKTIFETTTQISITKRLTAVVIHENTICKAAMKRGNLKPHQSSVETETEPLDLLRLS